MTFTFGPSTSTSYMSPRSTMSIPSSGSSTWRSASTTSSLIAMGLRVPLEAGEPNLLPALTLEEVDAFGESHPVAARAHDERVRPGTVRPEADAPEKIAVRDPGGADDRLLRAEVFGREHALDVLDPLLARLVDLAARHGQELSLELAAQTAQRGGRQHRLPRAADADRQVIVRAPDGGGDGSGDVAVLDQLDPSAGGADLLDQVVVPGPLEDDRRDVADPPSKGLRDRLDVLPDGPPEVDVPTCDRPDRHLSHVHVRKGLERSGLADRDHRHGSAAAAGDDAAPLERIDRQLDLGSPGAESHAGLEPFALAGGADHDRSVDGKLLQRLEHPRRRSLEGSRLVRPPEPPRTRQGRALGRPRKALAETRPERPITLGAELGSLGSDVGHDETCTRSAAARTSSSTPPIAFSRSEFSTTGTSSTCARSTM